jgi:hypothetical protein
MPEPDAAPRPRLALVVVIALLVGALVGGAAVAIVDRGRLDDQQAELTATQTELDATTAEAEELRAQLAAGEGTTTRLQRQLEQARADLETWVGPALPDGRHFGYLRAIGTAQEPPRLVVDLAEWYTDEAADQAAIEDGAMPPGQQHVENGYYIRNENPRWRIVEVDPAAPISIVLPPFGDIEQPAVVGLERFDQMLERRPWMLAVPYWLEVRDDVVVAIDQQFIP